MTNIFVYARKKRRQERGRKKKLALETRTWGNKKGVELTCSEGSMCAGGDKNVKKIISACFERVRVVWSAFGVNSRLVTGSLLLGGSGCCGRYALACTQRGPHGAQAGLGLVSDKLKSRRRCG